MAQLSALPGNVCIGFQMFGWKLTLRFNPERVASAFGGPCWLLDIEKMSNVPLTAKFA
jgi:hypothetical protein